MPVFASCIIKVYFLMCDLFYLGWIVAALLIISARTCGAQQTGNVSPAWETFIGHVPNVIRMYGASASLNSMRQIKTLYDATREQNKRREKPLCIKYHWNTSCFKILAMKSQSEIDWSHGIPERCSGFSKGATNGTRTQRYPPLQLSLLLLPPPPPLLPFLFNPNWHQPILSSLYMFFVPFSIPRYS